MWKVSWFYEKVHNIANFGGYAAILKDASRYQLWLEYNKQTVGSILWNGTKRNGMMD